MAIGLWIGLRQSVWFDEAYSIMVAKQSVGEAIRLTALDTHPPLYYLLLKAWACFFGWGELALRSLSVIFYGASITVAGGFIKKYFNARTAVYVLLTLLLTPLLMRYGFEIRMYAMASLIGVVATAMLVRAHSSKRWTDWLIYGALVALGMYTLYYLALLWLAHLVWLVAMDAGRLRKFSWKECRWIGAYAFSLLLFLPWLSSFLKQVGNGALAPIGQPMNLEQLVGVISFNTIYQPLWQLGVIASVLVVGVIFLATRAINKSLHIKKINRGILLLLVCYIVVPIAVLMLISLVKSMYVERYLAHVAIGLAMLAGASLTLSTERENREVWRIASPLVLLVVLAVGATNLSQVGNYNFQRMQKPNVNSVASVVKCSENDVVLAADPYVAIELDYYLPNCQIYFASNDEHLGGGYAPLDGSSRKVVDTKKAFTHAKNIYNVYYSDMKASLSGRYREAETIDLSPLKITKFSAE
jgi:putative inner membrane protein